MFQWLIFICITLFLQHLLWEQLRECGNKVSKSLIYGLIFLSSLVVQIRKVNMFIYKKVKGKVKVKEKEPKLKHRHRISSLQESPS